MSTKASLPLPPGTSPNNKPTAPGGNSAGAAPPGAPGGAGRRTTAMASFSGASDKKRKFKLVRMEILLHCVVLFCLVHLNGT